MCRDRSFAVWISAHSDRIPWRPQQKARLFPPAERPFSQAFGNFSGLRPSWVEVTSDTVSVEATDNRSGRSCSVAVGLCQPRGPCRIPANRPAPVPQPALAAPSDGSPPNESEHSHPSGLADPTSWTHFTRSRLPFTPLPAGRVENTLRIGWSPGQGFQ